MRSREYDMRSRECTPRNTARTKWKRLCQRNEKGYEHNDAVQNQHRKESARASGLTSAPLHDRPGPSRLEEVDSARAGANLRTWGYENQHGAPTEVSKSDLLASRL